MIVVLIVAMLVFSGAIAFLHEDPSVRQWAQNIVTALVGGLLGGLVGYFTGKAGS